MHPVDELAHALGVVQQDGLGELELDEAPVHLVFVADGLAFFQEIRRAQVLAGEIHRHRAQFPALLFPAGQVAADLFKDELVDAGDEAVLFQHRDEHRRGEHAPLGVLPADERLGAGDPPVLQADLGLVIHLEVAGPQRGVQPVDRFFFFQLGLLPGGVVEGAAPVHLIANLARGAAALFHGSHVGLAGPGRIRAEAKLQIIGVFPVRVECVGFLIHLLQPMLDLFLVLPLQQHIEQVGGGAGDKLARAQAAFQRVVEIAQGAVALFDAIDVVHQLEALHVRGDKGVVAALFQKERSVVAETGVALAAGEGVHEGHVLQAGLIAAAQDGHGDEHAAKNDAQQQGEPQVLGHQRVDGLAQQVSGNDGEHIPVVGHQRDVAHQHRRAAFFDPCHAGPARADVIIHLAELGALLFRAVQPGIPKKGGQFIAFAGGQQFAVPGDDPGRALAVEALGGEHAGEQAGVLDAQQHRVFLGLPGGVVDAQFRLAGHDQLGGAGMHHVVARQRGTALPDPRLGFLRIGRQIQLVKPGYRRLARQKFRQRLLVQKHGAVPDDVHAFH